ncbi:hypothetical protein SAMN04487949_0434 [Halogranum gelatinilyticum]|uniref:Small CPxCG-related zinc finger protein n=1 Tax=Halogranum gelatinilyticum TaxID=660521 RepID=A0A1G9PKS4_9EURY|nr:DUF6276 family protein [Halogranum gelatinilyticum]SDL99452.1 hypothetical protein SAMN04487949_0434 [Halogranum gelatinilyticum]
MVCPQCDVETAVFAVPPSLRDYVPSASASASFCPQCLRVRSVDSEPPDDADFGVVGPFFPDGEGGVATALLVGNLDSLALNRSAIEVLAAHAEREGVDLFLVLSRLATVAPEAHVDLDRRLVQLEQLLD